MSSFYKIFLKHLEEVVALVVNQDECGEVFDFNLPNRFHSEFGVFDKLDFLDVSLCKKGSRAAD